MDGQRARLVTTALDRVAPIPRAVSAPAKNGPLRLTRAWAVVLGVGWPLAIVASVALEPAPVDPEAAVPPLIELASLGLLVALLATAVAAGVRHPVAAVAGLATGLISLVFTVSCPVSGHHAFGAWWFGQLGLTLVMLAASGAALGRRAYEP